MRSASLLLLLLLLLAESALAQTALQPQVKAGDQWQFATYYSVPSSEPNRHWVVTSVGPGGIEGTENGERLLLTPELNVIDSPRQADSNPRALSFPLHVGKRWRYGTDWEFKAKGSRGSAIVDVEVVGFEKVTVPAGEFDSYKLSARGTLHGTSPINSQYGGEVVTSYWYAPSVRAVVKSVSHNPYLGTSTVELVSFHLGP